MLQIILKFYSFYIRTIWEPVGFFIGRLYLGGHGVIFGDGLRVYGLPTINVCKGSVIKIGNSSVIRSKSRGNAIGVNHEVILRTMSKDAQINIGDRFGISGGAICAVNMVNIGNDVMLGANVVIADNDFHGIKFEDRKVPAANLPTKPIKIEDGVWVGADVYVCKGVTLGKNCVIGAKSVVTKSIPENCIAAGVPAKIIASLDDYK